MKRQLLMMLCLFGTAFIANAQLKVANDGKTYLQRSINDGHSILSIGEGPNLGFASYQANDSLGIHVHKYKTNNGDCLGIRSQGWRDGGNGNTVGVLGEAYGTQTSYMNYGVAGTIDFLSLGAGIVGTTEGDLPPFGAVNGNYAGYFYGDAFVEGYLTTTCGLYNYSDMRLKKNVTAFASKESTAGRAVDNLQRLEVIEYNLRRPWRDETGLDGEKNAMEESKDNRRHYGISAQALQEIYPDLVLEGQDGYLTVNYTELIPILIRSIQELKQELEESRSHGDASRRQALAGTDNIGVSPTNAVLYQNAPNPFTAQTEIRFSLPENTPQAYIYIFDMTGKMQKQIPVEASRKSITLTGYELQPGIYLYSLVVGGQEIDTKRMILSK